MRRILVCQQAELQALQVCATWLGCRCRCQSEVQCHGWWPPAAVVGVSSRLEPVLSCQAAWADSVMLWVGAHCCSITPP